MTSDLRPHVLKRLGGEAFLVKMVVAEEVLPFSVAEESKWGPWRTQDAATRRQAYAMRPHRWPMDTRVASK